MTTGWRRSAQTWLIKQLMRLWRRWRRRSRRAAAARPPPPTAPATGSDSDRGDSDGGSGGDRDGDEERATLHRVLRVVQTLTATPMDRQWLRGWHAAYRQQWRTIQRQFWLAVQRSGSGGTAAGAEPWTTHVEALTSALYRVQQAALRQLYSVLLGDDEENEEGEGQGQGEGEGGEV
eukprot:gene18061-12955_t